MFVVHRTTTILDRAGGPTVGSVEPSTTALGDWYDTVDLVDRTHGEVIGEALRAVPGIPTWRPCCPGLGRRGCLCTLPVLPALAEADGDVILSIASVTGQIAFREHAAAKAAGGDSPPRSPSRACASPASV